MNRTMSESKATKSLYRLLTNYKKNWTPKNEDYFKGLIRIILSQNTNWKNEESAFNLLNKKIGVNPKELADAKIDDISNAIKSAGMYNIRSRVIQKISMQVLQNNNDFQNLSFKPFKEARKILMDLPGVGKKTADVVLLFYFKHSVFPLDRHIIRITRRLGLVTEKDEYDLIRNILENAIDEKYYLDAHIILIQFGRDICKAINPRCFKCILSDLCDYQNLRQKKKPE